MMVSVRGLGAGIVHSYCEGHPPQADAIAIIQSQGDSWVTVPCGGSGGNQPIVTPVVTPTYTPYAGDPTCLSDECVQALLKHAAENQAAHDAAQAAQNRALCHSNWALNDAQFAALGLTRPPDTCDAAYPGPSSSAYYGNPTVPVYPETYSSGSPGPGSSGPGSSSGSGSSGTAGHVSIKNATTGNASSFVPGDQWVIDIYGAANSTVTVTGGKNGAGGSATMGTTDGSGHLQLNGTITADQVGQWSEAWKVGSSSVGSLSFSVVPATSKTTGGTTNGGGGTAPPSTDKTMLWVGAGVAALALILVAK